MGVSLKLFVLKDFLPFAFPFVENLIVGWTSQAILRAVSLPFEMFVLCLEHVAHGKEA